MPLTLTLTMRGFVSLKTLIYLIVFAALGVVTIAYGRVALNYYRIKQEANSLANNEIVAPEEEALAVSRLLTNVQNRTGLTLTRNDIVIKRDRNEPDAVTVDIHVVIPATFSPLQKTRYYPFVISVKEKRLKAY